MKKSTSRCARAPTALISPLNIVCAIDRPADIDGAGNRGAGSPFRGPRLA